MRRALKDPINSFTSTLESFFLNGQPLGKDQIGHLGEPILMHSSEITSSQINPALGVKLTTWRSWSWLYSEQSARLSPGLPWREQQLLVLRLIPAVEPVEIHCLPQRHSSAHIWWGCISEKVEFHQEVVDIKLCKQRFSGVLSHNPLHISFSPLKMFNSSFVFK